MLRFNHRNHSSFDLHEVIASGAVFFSCNQITDFKEESMDDGSVTLCAKAIDVFHFVSHPVVRVNPTDHLILSCTCDCGENCYGLCKHGVALLLSIGEQIDDQSGSKETLLQPTEMPGEITVRVIHEEMNHSQATIAKAADSTNTQDKPRSMIQAQNPGMVHETNVKEEPRAIPLQSSAGEENSTKVETIFEAPGIRVCLGHRLRSEDTLEWTPNDTERLFHCNTGIIGTMGTGKTQLTKSIICQFMRNAEKNYGSKNLGVLVFDYKGDYNETKEDFLNATGARVLKPYRLPYNPLALISPPTFKPLLPIHTANAFMDILSRIYPLGPKQQQLLLDCIRRAYGERGIDPNNPGTWKRMPPTFAMVHDLFVEETAGRPADSLTAAVNKLHDFSIFDDSRISVGSIRDLLSGVVVIDLSGYDQNIQNLVVAITLELFYAQMLTLGSSKTDGRYRQMRQLILVDEADNFMSKDFPALRRIMKEGREFGVGMILSTQSLSHFISGSDNYSRYVLSWIVHATTDLKQKDVEYIFKLPPKAGKTASIYSTIKKLEKHQSVVKLANDDPIIIQDLPFWKIVAAQQ